MWQWHPLTNLSPRSSTRQCRKAVCPTRVVILRITAKSKYGCDDSDEKFWFMLLVSWKPLLSTLLRSWWYGSREIQPQKESEWGVRTLMTNDFTEHFFSYGKLHFGLLGSNKFNDVVFSWTWRATKPYDNNKNYFFFVIAVSLIFLFIFHRRKH